MSISEKQFEKYRQESIDMLIRNGYPEAAEVFRQSSSIRWNAWQASRAALVVTLPAVEYFGDHWSGDWALPKDDVVVALESAGIKVKE